MISEQGRPYPLGIERERGWVNFALEVDREEECNLLLRLKGTEQVEKVPMTAQSGRIRHVAVPEECLKQMEYAYEISGQMRRDDYGQEVHAKDYFTAVFLPDYDWEGDRCLELPKEEVVAYTLHVRGFTNHRSSKAKNKGTFQGIVEKLPYLQELGVNQLQLMPIYSFAENPQYTNYWGYGPGYFFAPHEKYAGKESPSVACKDMIKACHKAGIEVVLSMPFAEGTGWQTMVQCLEFYVREYHVDGFILNPSRIPLERVREVPLLAYTKLLVLEDGYANVMRRFLKGDGNVAEEVMWWLAHSSRKTDSNRYLTTHTGFTLWDLVSYEEKHNEANGEYNQDGPDENYSWNCGVEGPTRKKRVLELRRRQVKNAFCLLLLTQGVPCILAGDEFANTQNGNNNIYCQDNETGWLVWKQGEWEQELGAFVKELLALRKAYPILRGSAKQQENPGTCGVPDLSFHGESAWQVPQQTECRCFGAYYHDSEAEEGDVFVAYNMHWNSHTLALPSLPKGKRWHLVLSTDDQKEAEHPVENKTIQIEERTVAVYIGR